MGNDGIKKLDIERKYDADIKRIKKGKKR